jgi:TonB-linked SusC/RagA family outer membrane protein
MKSANKIMLVLLFLVFQNNLTWGQSKKISGTVISQTDGIPLAGVSISRKGSSVGTQTSTDGRFSIAADKGDVIIFTSTGFLKLEVTIGSTDMLNITMKADETDLGEVVVVGYGTQKKSSLTASITKLDKRILETGVRANPAQALAGTIAGVRVSTTSGKPGALPAIVLRGGTNFNASGSPLVIVDGQFRPSLEDINPEEIESLEVLKDASATAIYGARASNGVILITSKRGKAGSSSISFKTRSGYNYLNSPYTLLTAEEYLFWGRRALVETFKVNGNQSLLNSTGPRGTGNIYKNAAGQIVDGNYDLNALFSPMFLSDANRELLNSGQGWRVMKDAIPTNATGGYDPVSGTYKDILYKEFSYADNAFRNKAVLQDYNVGMSGGNDRGTYYANLGMYNEDGIAKSSFYRRLNFVINGDYKIKSWLKSESSVAYARANWRDQAQTSDANYWGRILMAAPTMRGVNANGDVLLGRNAGDGNPTLNEPQFIRRNQSDKFTLSQSFKADLLKNLYFKVGGIFMYDEQVSESFNKDYRTGVMSYTNPNTGWNRDRISSASFDRVFRQTYNAILNYKAELFGKSNLDAMVGGEYFDVYNNGMSAGGRLAPTVDFEALRYTSTDANQRSIGSYHTAERILSAFGRVNYDWDGKYLASFTARRDGYSRLIGDNQYGIFPGASFGWLAHKEKFMEGTSDWLSLLKLRGSWGNNGNIGGIGLYELQGGYNTTGRYENIIGFNLAGIPNPQLRWEKTNTVEAAIEYGLFKNSITGTIGVYKRITNDKIADVLLPNSTGVSSIRTNNGSMQNKGFEADMFVKVIQNKDLDIRLGANIAWNKNKILKLPFNGNENNRQGGIQIYDPITGKLIWVGGLQEGQEPNEVFGYMIEGLIRNEKDLADYNKIDLAAGQVQLNAAAGRPLTSQKLITQRGLNPSQWWTTSLGDVRWKDVDKNDTIDFRDRVSMGRTIPRWTGGFNLSVGWKGLQLFARMDYALGFMQMDFRQMWAMGSMQGEFNGTNYVKDTWTPENPNARFPIYVNQDQQLKKNYDRYSNLFWVNSSYLCFRELTLSYAVPNKILKRAKIEGLTLMMTGQNLGYISNKMLKLPERNGQEDGAYTIPTQLVFSANLTF